mgnify:CR=1 FL=1
MHVFFMDALHNESVERLFRVIMSLENLEECHDFFSDVCTVKEVLDMAQRLDTAFMLDAGTSYQQISAQRQDFLNSEKVLIFSQILDQLICTKN